MKYMGSKSRISKDIVPIIQSYINDITFAYIEPFVGGANVVDKIAHNNIICGDKNKYLIELYRNLDKLNTLPDFVTKEHYVDVRNSYHSNDGRYEDYYIGMIGFLASYNGRFYDGGYAGLVHTKDGGIRNYYDEAKRNLIKQSEHLQGIEFHCGDYTDFSKYSHSVIYCDPPYANTTTYTSKGFNTDKFWDWCKYMADKDNIVLVSEQTSPDDPCIQCIWEQPIKRTIDNVKSLNSVERLYIVKCD